MKTPSQEIDAIIKDEGGWKGEKLAKLRSIIIKADPDIVEEVKWKKPSNPKGVGVWSYNGIICVEKQAQGFCKADIPKWPRD